MLLSALIYLCAAVLAVPLARKLGLGSVLGYLLAGVAIGPFVLALVGDQTEVMHFAEFGVVMMLFLIGLELRPGRLWEMRRPILGLGGAQVLLTIVLVALAAYVLLDLESKTAFAVGLALAGSSTAIVLQLLNERGLLKTQAGENIFSVILCQDIAVIPILALLPLLAVTGAGTESASHGALAGYPGWLQASISVFVIISIIFAGRYLSAPVFRIIANTHLRELFTAFALLIVVAIAVLMEAIGLSAALGTFLAGVVLADSEFRHELEVDIEPFKGLLLGLFFITVGAGIDFSLVMNQPALVIGLIIGVILLKVVALATLAFIFGMVRSQGLLFTLALAQGGEFAFVIVSSGSQFGVFNTELGNLITLVVALSMIITPFLIAAYEAVMSRPEQQASVREDEDIRPSCQVIIAGYGRFGQIVGRLLGAQGYELTILDHSPSQVELVRRFGVTVYYGDASRRDLLQAAGADQARLLVVAVDEPDKALEIVDTANKHFPQLKILARALDRRHAYELMRTDVDGIRRETFGSALDMGVDALKSLGQPAARAERAGDLFRAHDEQSMQSLFELWGDDKSYGVAVRQRMEDLARVLQADQDEQHADLDENQLDGDRGDLLNSGKGA